MFEIDQMAYSSPLRRWSPAGKLLLTLALLIGSIMAPGPAVPLLVLAIGLVLLNASCGFKLPDIVHMACMDGVLILAVTVAAILLWTPGHLMGQWNTPWFSLSVTHEALNLAILLFVRVAAGFTVLLAFSTSTPVPHLFQALRSLGLPAFLAELVVLVYRYSFMILEQMGQMYTAAECRMGFCTLRQSLRTTGQLAAELFGRSMDFAERAQAALYSRNFMGEFTPFRAPAPLTAGWAGASVLVLGLLVALGHLSAGWLVF